MPARANRSETATYFELSFELIRPWESTTQGNLPLPSGSTISPLISLYDEGILKGSIMLFFSQAFQDFFKSDEVDNIFLVIFKQKIKSVEIAVFLVFFP